MTLTVRAARPAEWLGASGFRSFGIATSLWRRIGIPECRKEVESEMNSVFEIDDHFVP